MYVYPNFLPHGASNASTTCSIAVEDFPAEDASVCLRCGVPGHTITNVTLARFGNFTGSCDGGQPITPGSCQADPSVVQTVAEKACLGMAGCSVPADVKLFGADPCVGVVKTLAVEVACGVSQCGIVTENWPDETNAVNVGCPTGHTITAVTQALFGLVTGNCVDGFTLGKCGSDPAVVADYVRKQCVGKQGCAVPANVKLFGRDPCPGQYKQLAVVVKCD